MSKRLTKQQLDRAEERAMQFAHEMQMNRVKPTEKGEQIAEAISNMETVCEDAQEEIRKLVELITGETIPPIDSSGIHKEAKQGAVFVYEEDSDGEMTMGICYRQAGERNRYSSLVDFGRDNMGTLCEDEVVRWATVNEVETYFAIIRGMTFFGMEVSEDFPTRQ